MSKKVEKKVNELVTERIIEQMKEGIIPWEKPWTGQGRCISHLTGKPYSFLNELLLGCEGEYATFKQIQDVGGKVKKGAKAKMVTFWKMLKVKDDDNKDKDGKQLYKIIPMLKYFNVFNIAIDCEGVELKHIDKIPEKTFNDDMTSEKLIQNYFDKYAIKFENILQNKAYYSPMEDKVVLPLKKQFEIENAYYSTLFHEAVHSTGHQSRLKRIDMVKIAAFGKEEYSKEELVAEIGAATLMNMFNLETVDTFKNNTAYIQSWIKVLKNDNNMIISASSRAGKAVDMILDRQEKKETK